MKQTRKYIHIEKHELENLLKVLKRGIIKTYLSEKENQCFLQLINELSMVLYKHCLKKEKLRLKICYLLSDYYTIEKAERLYEKLDNDVNFKITVKQLVYLNYFMAKAEDNIKSPDIYDMCVRLQDNISRIYVNLIK